VRVAPPSTIAAIQPLAAPTPLSPETVAATQPPTVAPTNPPDPTTAQTTIAPPPTSPPVTTTALPRFPNCAALNAVYPNGVGREGAVDGVRGNTKPVTNFLVDTALYNAQPRTLDGDNDGVACEKS
jgi:Excalibur calcium-binding domain